MVFLVFCRHLLLWLSLTSAYSLHALDCTSEIPAQNRYDLVFEVVGDLLGIDPCKHKAQLLVENSTLDRYATSPVGAIGCAQIMPATWNEWTRDKHDLRTFKQKNCIDSIIVSGLIMAGHLEFWSNYKDGSLSEDEVWNFSVAAYNRGRQGVLNDLERSGVLRPVWRLVRKVVNHETSQYVDKIKFLHGLLLRR